MTSVLFVRLSAMGDLVQGLGAIQSLHRARPGWRLAVATQTPFAPLLDGCAAIHAVHTFDRRGGVVGFLQLRAGLRAARYDVAVDLQGNWKSALVARSCGAPTVVGAGGRARQEALSGVLLTARVRIGGVAHPARVAWRLAQRLVPGLPFALPSLHATAAEVEREAAAVRSLGVDPGRAFRTVVVTDAQDPRALRPTVVAHEARTGAVLLLGPAERHVPLPAGARVLRHERGEVRRLVALGELLRASGGTCVGPDQGATHVLAAAGARCVVAYGPQDPQRTAPPAAEVRVRADGPVCRPCSRRRCRHAEGPVCMEFAVADGRRVAIGLPEPGACDEPGA